MKVSILCSDLAHPVVPHLRAWMDSHPHHEVEIVQRKADLAGGQLLFLVSCSEMIRSDTKVLYDHSVVIHASNVPHGRGFAPLNWQIIKGVDPIVVTMMDAAEKVDTGDIYHQISFSNEGHETFSEMFDKLFEAELELMNYALENFESLSGRPQPADEPGSYFRRRTSADSVVDVNSGLAEVFDLLRASDPKRYPVTFTHRGHQYILKLEKVEPPMAPFAVVDEADAAKPNSALS